MNGKATKICREIAWVKDMSLKQAKRFWLSMSHRDRGTFRGAWSRIMRKHGFGSAKA